LKVLITIVLFIIVIAVLLSSGIAYYEEMNDSFNKEKALMKRTIKDKTIEFQQKISLYDDYENTLQDKFDIKKKFLESRNKRLIDALKEKYGKYDEFKTMTLDKYSNTKKELNQREKSLKNWENELIKKEQTLSNKEVILSNINLECRLFDKKKLEKYLRAFHRVSYATLDYVSLACGTNIKNKMVSPKKCLDSQRDRISSKNLLLIINKLSYQVGNGGDYRQFTKEANSLMRF